MDERTVPLLCDPETHDSLQLDRGALLNPSSGSRYPIRDGVPIFFGALSGSNKKYQELYDRIALFYDPAEALYRWLFPQRDLRAEYLKELDLARAHACWRSRSEPGRTYGTFGLTVRFSVSTSNGECSSGARNNL